MNLPSTLTDCVRVNSSLFPQRLSASISAKNAADFDVSKIKFLLANENQCIDAMEYPKTKLIYSSLRILSTYGIPGEYSWLDCHDLLCYLLIILIDWMHVLYLETHTSTSKHTDSCNGLGPTDNKPLHELLWPRSVTPYGVTKPRWFNEWKCPLKETFADHNVFPLWRSIPKKQTQCIGQRQLQGETWKR